MLQKIDGKLVVMGNVPTPGTVLGKSFSSRNFQAAVGPKPAPTPPPAATQAPVNPASASTGAPAKP